MSLTTGTSHVRSKLVNDNIEWNYTIWHNWYADAHTVTIYQSFIHDYTYTANCLIDSQSPTHRRHVADQSPTSCRPIATHFQSVGNQSPTSRRPVADWSQIFGDSCRRPVADWSATEKMQFWSHSDCIGCSCFLVARQSLTGCSTCVTGALVSSSGKQQYQRTNDSGEV